MRFDITEVDTLLVSSKYTDALIISGHFEERLFKLLPYLLRACFAALSAPNLSAARVDDAARGSSVLDADADASSSLSTD